MITLQEQYNSIKKGQGSKEQFLKQARLLFPQYLNQYSDFNTATNVLKSKQIISEAVGGVVSKGFDIWNWKKILAEETKSVEKETSKEVLDAQSHAYDYKDIKNADNINFNEIMKGFYAEMRGEKNAGKTGDEIKAMVVKNLAKDPLFYTKNGEFGIKDLGYTTEAPGLGEPKEPKRKHKSSGYGDIDKEVKVKANVQDSLGDKEAKDSMPKKVKEMSVTPQNSAGVKKMKMPGAEKKMKLQENLGHNEISSITPEGRFWIVTYRTMDGTKEKSFNSEKEAKQFLMNQDTDPNLGEPIEEQKLRSLIRNLIKEELNERSININGKIVKTYTQNGDKSYNVTYDDGTKDIIMVSNDAWDEINTLHQNATKN